MSPKFRGDDEDWLDDQGRGASSRSSKKKEKKEAPARSRGLSWADGNGIVSEIFPKQCRVKMISDGAEFLCSYRRADVVGKTAQPQEVRERSPVAVGDRVLVRKVGQSDGVVEGVCSRRNALTRPAPGRDPHFHHVVACNIDLLVIVASVKDPEFSPGLVDRFLIAAQVEKIPTLICLSKYDLHQDQEHPWSMYRDLGFDLVEASVKENIGISEIENRAKGKSVVFCGHSGVGKTSLLRALLGLQIGKIQEVNELTGKGRHTTTGAVLLGGPDGSQWVDTPGVREFGLVKVSQEELRKYFPEFLDLPCSRMDCLHQEESECAARGLARYSSYRRIFESLAPPLH